MAQADINSFSLWLSSELRELKLDDNVYTDYIIGILEGDESPEEKMETISSILNYSEQNNVSVNCEKVLDKWNSLFNNVPTSSAHVEKENIDQQFSRLLEENVRLEETAQNHSYTVEQLKIRETILSQYAHADVVDDYEDDDDDVDNVENKMSGVEKNINATTVQQAEKEKREKAKIENQMKKVKDKEDREKQKLTAQEKKEARRKKAQKVERHRF